MDGWDGGYSPQAIVETSSSNSTMKCPPEPEARINEQCLCLNTDFDDVENVATHIAGCILGQTVTDENLPSIITALELYKKR